LISAVDTTVHRLCCFSVQLFTASAAFRYSCPPLLHFGAAAHRLCCISVEAQGFSPAIQYPKNPASAAGSIHIGRAR